MGEKIRTLSKGKLLNTKFEIELNHPTISGQDEQIHIQSDKFRFEIDKKDYIRYSIIFCSQNFKFTIKTII